MSMGALLRRSAPVFATVMALAVLAPALSVGWLRVEWLREGPGSAGVVWPGIAVALSLIGAATVIGIIAGDIARRSAKRPLRHAERQRAAVQIAARYEQARAEAQAAQDRVDSLLETSNAIVVGLDLKGRVTVLNRAAEELLGYSREELMGRDWVDAMVPAEWQARVRDTIARSGMGDPVRGFENPVRTKAGAVRRISWQSGLASQDGRVTGTLSFGIDLTERIRAEEALAQSDARYRAFVASSVDGIWRIDLPAPMPTGLSLDEQERHILAHAYIADCNEAYVRMSGRASVAELRGTPVSQIQGPRAQADRVVIRRFVESGYELRGSELLIPTGRGDTLVLEVNCVGELEGGQLRRAWAIARNVTQERAMRDELSRLNAELELRVQARTRALEEANDELARSNAELEHLAYVASHDLKEPLRYITSTAHLLRMEASVKLSPEAEALIADIVAGATRLSDLIDALLAYSRVGRTGAPWIPVDLNDTLRDVLRDLGPALADARATVTSEGLPVVHGDPQQLHQLLLNLVGNALKFTAHDHPTVRVTASSSREEHVVSVADNGIGIDDWNLERVFGLFQRLHRGEYSGTGIGLAICKRIVDHHLGRIWVESRVGVGSTFRFALPAERVAQPDGSAAP
jgi:PAS domain S-box-containing protein